jgi:hypothetical protein
MSTSVWIKDYPLTLGALFLASVLRIAANFKRLARAGFAIPRFANSGYFRHHLARLPEPR